MIAFFYGCVNGQFSNKNVKERMIPVKNLYNLAELFKVFSGSTRIQILLVLFEEEVCVCNIRENSSFTLADDHVRTIIAQRLNHIAEGL